MRKRAVIFDLDGLMIDSERVTYDCMVEACADLGFVMDMEAYQTLLGLPVKRIKERLLLRYGPGFPADAFMERVHAGIAQTFEERGVPVKKGLRELLSYLKGAGYILVLATSSDRDRVDGILEKTGLTEDFPVAICGDEIERGKPNPDVFLKCCQKAGVAPREAFVLEDSEMGTLAACRAGIDCIVVPDLKYPAPEYQRMAYRIVDSLLDALDFIRLQEAADVG